MSGSVERFFEHLSARDWASLRRDLTTDVERVGPFGDRVSGRERYLAMLEEAVPADYGNDVHLVTYAADGLAAFARVTEHLGYPKGTLHLEEAYAFGLDGEGLVTRVEVFWQTPSGRRGEPVEAAGISPHDAMVERRYEEWDRDLTLVRAAARDLSTAEIGLRHQVGVARRSGHSWSAIAVVLGITEDDARGRFGWPDDDAPQ